MSKTFQVQDLVRELMLYPLDAAVVIRDGDKLQSVRLMAGRGIKRGDRDELSMKQFDVRHKAKVVLITSDE